MIPEKEIPLHELKYYYGENLGFVFRGEFPSSNDAIQRLVDTIVRIKVSEKPPEFYVRVSPNEVAFIFDGNSGFQSALFYQATRQFSQTGLFEIDTLAAWLKTRP
jgi:hypothetical protein